MLKEKKPREVEDMAVLMKAHRVIGVLNMRKLPAKQLQQIRSRLGPAATIRMSRKSLMKRAIEAAGDEHLKILTERLDDGVPALILSNENPFRLFRIIRENRSRAAAKPGDVAPADITITKGPTGLPPGPAISTLQKVGLQASVQGGKIHVMRDKVVCKQGETVSVDLASVLNLLKFEPIEIGLDVIVLLEEGTLYGRDVLAIDPAEYRAWIEAAALHATNLSLNVGFIVFDTAPLAIAKAFGEARQLCIEADILDAAFIEDVLAKAVRTAKVLSQGIPDAPAEQSSVADVPCDELNAAETKEES